MATTVYDEEVISLQDGTEVVLYPLAIGRLKKFMKAWKAMFEVNDDDDAIFDIYVTCAGIALEKQLKDEVDTPKPVQPSGKLSPEYREYLEEVLDLDTIFKVLEICGGLKLNDPKLLEEVQKQVVANAQADGKN